MKRILLISTMAVVAVSANAALLNSGFEGPNANPIYTGAAAFWGNSPEGLPSMGNAGGIAPHANHPAGNPNAYALGTFFAYSSPNIGGEIMGQITDQRGEAGKIYKFRSLATNGGSDNAVYTIGYMNVDNGGVLDYMVLETAQYTITRDWQAYAGVTLTLAAGSPAIGKQIAVAFGNSGNNTGGGVWVDNAEFEVVPEPATMIALGMGVLALARKRRK